MSRKNLFNIDNLSAQDIDENAELIPLMTPEDELEIIKEELPLTLPILSLRNTVLLPGVVITITASREKSIKSNLFKQKRKIQQKRKTKKMSLVNIINDMLK